MNINLNEKINNLQIRIRAMFDRDPLKADDTGEGRWMTILISSFVILLGAIFAHYMLFTDIERSIDVGSDAEPVQSVSLNTAALKKVNDYYKNRSTDYDRSISSPDKFVDPSR